MCSDTQLHMWQSAGKRRTGALSRFTSTSTCTGGKAVTHPKHMSNIQFDPAGIEENRIPEEAVPASSGCLRLGSSCPAQSYSNISSTDEPSGVFVPGHLLLLCEHYKRPPKGPKPKPPGVTLRWQHQLRCFKCGRKQTLMLTAEAFLQIPLFLYNEHFCFLFGFPRRLVLTVARFFFVSSPMRPTQTRY